MGRGSSPRVRGKHTLSTAQEKVHGLIPACAGKTLYLVVEWIKLVAHPRVCGENFSESCHESNTRGSSPRVRGKPGACLRMRTHGGLIPACAGKT